MPTPALALFHPLSATTARWYRRLGSSEALIGLDIEYDFFILKSLPSVFHGLFHFPYIVS